MRSNHPPSPRLLLSASFILLFDALASAQMGHVLNGVGPVNQGMAGVATAAPIDAAGALNWNPGSITALGHSEFAFGFELLIPDASIDSSMPAGFGGASGSTASDAGSSTIPSFAFVHSLEDSNWTVGLGAYGLSGFGVDYPVSDSNPILAPPAQGGFGSVYSQFQMLQMAPTFAYRFNPNWSAGFSPTINQAQLAITPACFESPNADGAYPDGRSAAKAWGFGGQVGVYFEGDSGWNAGASYKSTQWFEPFEFNSTAADGSYRRLQLDMDFPSISSLGLSYTGFERWVIAADVRYIDYASTNGFKESGFNSADFSVNGFGWDSILVGALGVQYDLATRWKVRGGYSFNENPIANSQSTFNLPAPAVIQHHVSIGLSYCFGDSSCIDLAYRHGFENSVEGEIGHPTMGPIPGSSVKNTLSTDSILLGFRVSY